MLLRSILFASLVILTSGKPQAPVELHSPGPLPPGGQPPAGPAPGGQDPSHDHAADHQPPATIVKNEFEDSGKGTFRWEFETSDGSRAEQTGHTVNPGTDQEGEVIQGSYSYKSPDGQVISVTYIADQNGFQPKGDHLPTAPSNPNASNSTTSAVSAGASAAAGSPSSSASPPPPAAGSPSSSAAPPPPAAAAPQQS